MKILIKESNYLDPEGDVVSMPNAVLYRGTASLSYRDKMLAKDLTVNSEGECCFAKSVNAAFGYGYAVVQFKLNRTLRLKISDNPSKENHEALMSRGLDGVVWRDYIILINLEKLETATTECIMLLELSKPTHCVVPCDLTTAGLVKITKEEFPAVVFIQSRLFDGRCADSSIVLCETMPDGSVRVCGTTSKAVTTDYGYTYEECLTK